MNRSYLILLRASKIDVRSVPQRNGGTKYAVDQLLNNESIVLLPSALCENNVLIRGTVGTGYDNQVATDLYKGLTKCIRRASKKIQYAYVMENAYRLLENGWRLTINAQGPNGSDLKITV